MPHIVVTSPSAPTRSPATENTSLRVNNDHHEAPAPVVSTFPTCSHCVDTFNFTPWRQRFRGRTETPKKCIGRSERYPTRYIQHAWSRKGQILAPYIGQASDDAYRMPADENKFILCFFIILSHFTHRFDEFLKIKSVLNISYPSI